MFLRSLVLAIGWFPCIPQQIFEMVGFLVLGFLVAQISPNQTPNKSKNNKTNRSNEVWNGQEIVGNLLEGVLYTSYISATTLSRV